MKSFLLTFALLVVSVPAFSAVIPCEVPPAQCKRLCGNSFYNGTYNATNNTCDAHIAQKSARVNVNGVKDIIEPAGAISAKHRKHKYSHGDFGSCSCGAVKF